MTAPAFSTSSRTPIGKHLIHVAVRLGRLVNQLETRILHSRMLAAVPFTYRQIGFQTFKLILVLAVASVAIVLAIGMIALWTIAALPIRASDDEPDVFEVSHPRHRFKYPEMYDDHGSLR
ncbi:hypothetical protein FHJ31_18685 [Pseudomonas sp. Fig-3]|uniref:hypothetical protein n=1 Tax=unclassified Pseudomonas TaxID=196821 RepID=UPI0010DEA727|nr:MULTISPECIES: hypothetical protein [unclassified Pseudomonas]TNB81545.1 hypothetical protein FHJ31_18685 [Pseudomonas sp. Fig-3]VII91675.1 hypothetical protein [Pseudomonas sp. FG-3G]